MDRRLQLQKIFEDLIENDNVYYQPPESLKMSYPCIRYSLSRHIDRYADNRKYINRKCYEVIVIDRNPESKIPDKILEVLPYSNLDRFYSADNLNHFAMTIYY